ncbi:uncharacterized protein LOC114877509 [Osmia bicornis bicornis]|uniref:uncharacterized protein LOC114877509 n=1 Tax=Osmia bicornis bicornis TaxID=1437191 RepID=UPI0010F9AE6C|nr:uncharacterized protein LOC114877509 [Osmia bicornis bicornis]
MFVTRGYLLITILAVASSAPRRGRRSTVPGWHLPCGVALDTELPSISSLDEEIGASIESLRLQHRLAMDDYLNRDYEYLYERVRIGVHEHQYIPNWVPGEKDISIVRRLNKAKPQTIANNFPKLHMDLQKFAVAFEEVIEDETDPKVYEALEATQSYLMMMLCEVESNIVALPFLRVPSRVERSIMSRTERHPVDDTRRLVRDWGVLLKYKNYLHAWRHVFNF